MSDAFDLLSKTELSRRRARLLARIHRRYKTANESFVIGPLRITFTRVADPNVVLDEVCAEEDAREKNTNDRRDGNDLHLPYWAELWDSAIGVGHFLVQSHSSPARLLDPKVLDLGCGMGLAGTVAAAMGHHVLFADIETPALLFAKLNSLPYSNRVRLRRLNWQRDRLGEQFDLILGADVLYEKAQWEYLEPFWREHLAEGGSILLGEPGRQTGDLFADWIAARGWRREVFSQKVSTRATPIRLFQLNRRANPNDETRMTKPE